MHGQPVVRTVVVARANLTHRTGHDVLTAGGEIGGREGVSELLLNILAKQLNIT